MEFYWLQNQLTNNFLSYICVHSKCKASLKLSLEISNKNSKIDIIKIDIHDKRPQ